MNITDTIWRNRIADAAELELDTGLGNDNVFASLAAFGNSPLIIRTEGEFNYRMRLRGGLNIATLTNPADEISVTVDGNQLSNNQYRAVLDQNAIDLKISGNLSSESVVEAQITRVNRGRVLRSRDNENTSSITSSMRVRRLSFSQLGRSCFRVKITFFTRSVRSNLSLSSMAGSTSSVMTILFGRPREFSANYELCSHLGNAMTTL